MQVGWLNSSVVFFPVSLERERKQWVREVENYKAVIYRDIKLISRLESQHAYIL